MPLSITSIVEGKCYIKAQQIISLSFIGTLLHFEHYILERVTLETAFLSWK